MMYFLIATLFFIIGLVVGIVAMFIRDTHYIHEVIEIEDDLVKRVHENDMRQMKRMAAVINEYQMRELSRHIGNKPMILRATSLPRTDWVELDFSNMGSIDGIDFPNSRKENKDHGNDNED